MTDDITLGLTLSGGAAFGAAHVGVLQELAERGIRPGITAGTSSGALVAAAYAAGFDVHQIERVARSFRWRDIARWSFAPRLGLLDAGALHDAVHRVFGHDPLIEALPRRFAAVATDLGARRTVTIDQGSLSTALRATIAVPGLLAPVRRDGAWLADGGMLDNVPVAATRALGADRVIVVHLHAKWESVRMMRTTGRVADLERDPSVVLIQPEMERMAQWTMADAPRLIAEGRRAAAAALDAAAPFATASPSHAADVPRHAPHRTPLVAHHPRSRSRAEVR
ncbi:patatin-like phospholipase family protein [Agromyces sp. MMS24-K17]|uniref:patatin-like phospholipase family protein n=1 Tax=Agromyces sp. MMS24-K17 TaxID=3372850 RepID=UPI00375401B4